jgi:hypothetical protein
MRAIMASLVLPITSSAMINESAEAQLFNGAIEQ